MEIKATNRRETDMGIEFTISLSENGLNPLQLKATEIHSFNGEERMIWAMLSNKTNSDFNHVFGLGWMSDELRVMTTPIN